MRAGLLVLVAALSGCDFKLDILGDDQPSECQWGETGYCLPDPPSIQIADTYSDPTGATGFTIARGGLVALDVWNGDADSQDEMEAEVEGGELVAQEDRHMVVRASAATTTVSITIGGYQDSILLLSLPVDDLAVVPLEEQFQLAAAPVDFAIAGAASIAAVVQLRSGDTRLLDDSVTATGPAIADQPRWDLVDIDGAAQPTEFNLHAESVTVDVAIDAAGPLDSIEVVSGPTLSDATAPIQLDAEGHATVCFTGTAGGTAVAGLTWSIDGAAGASDGCAFLNQFSSTLTVSAGGLTRSVELELIAPP
jgi:hypothetical protein